MVQADLGTSEEKMWMFVNTAAGGLNAARVVGRLPCVYSYTLLPISVTDRNISTCGIGT